MKKNYKNKKKTIPKIYQNFAKNT